MSNVRRKLDVPITIWKRIASFCESPLELLTISEVLRGAFVAATSDSLWDAFSPYVLSRNLYRDFIERVKKLGEEDIDLLRAFWASVPAQREKYYKGDEEDEEYDETFDADCYDLEDEIQLEKNTKNNEWLVAGCTIQNILSHEPFGLHDLDVALAVGCSSIEDQLLDKGALADLFEPCFEDPRFCSVLLRYAPYKVFYYYELQTLEYLPLISDLPEVWEKIPCLKRAMRKDPVLVRRTLERDPCQFINIFTPHFPCADPELVLDSVEKCVSLWMLDDVYYTELWEALDPSLRSRNFCMELAQRGFPIWLVDIGMVDLDFYLICDRLDIFPPEYLNDKQISLIAVQRNSLNYENSIPSLKNDKDIILATLQNDIDSLCMFDESIISEDWLMKAFREALENTDRGPAHVPEQLQTRECAEIAARKGFCGSFTNFLDDLELLKLSVKVNPMGTLYCILNCDTRDEYSRELCEINPDAIWYTTQEFFNANLDLVRKALHNGIPAGPRVNCLDWDDHRELLIHAVRSHESTFKRLAEANPRYYADKELVMAALDVADGSILWRLPKELIDDEDIWRKAIANRDHKLKQLSSEFTTAFSIEHADSNRL